MHFPAKVRTALCKLCGAGLRGFCHPDRVRQRILCLLTDRRTDLKSEWEKRLRAEPVRSALGHPDILMYMMDETLDQLADLLLRRQTARVRHPADFESRCRCHFNPLLAYFSTGIDALLAVLAQEASLDEPARAAAGAWWGLLAQQEVDAVCGACVRPCAEPYPLIKTMLTPTPPCGGGGRGKS